MISLNLLFKEERFDFVRKTRYNFYALSDEGKLEWIKKALERDKKYQVFSFKTQLFLFLLFLCTDLNYNFILQQKRDKHFDMYGLKAPALGDLLSKTHQILYDRARGMPEKPPL